MAYLGAMPNLGGMLNPQATTEGWGATVNPAASGNAAGMNPLAMLANFKGPQQSSPIMSGGVSGGGQQAPQANLAALQSNPLMAAIMQMIQGGGAGARQVPGIGQLLRGGLMRV